YTHFDTAEMYASGHAEELLGQAIRETKIKREALFITSKVMPSHLKYDQALKSCENSLLRLQLDYVDLYLIHWPEAGMKLKDTFRSLNKLVKDGRVKHLGVSNFNLKLLKESQVHSETPIRTNQVPYSLSERSYVKNGVLEYCQGNDILLTAYSPIEQGKLRSNSSLEAVAMAHNATPYQIALAWVISKPSIVTIPMSLNPKHIAENFQAADIELSGQEIEQLTGEYSGK
ncbi:MAG TPA: aldo/keto reductase, partial [Anaerolineales bacterium]|nr:aldo/keto reductase [Anaerolineales bacterium]